MTIEIAYDKAAPLRTSPCLAWLVEYEAGGRDLLMTSPDFAVEDVVRMIQNHTHDDFKVSNITVGCLPLMAEDEQVNRVPEHLTYWFSLYFNDARKVDSAGMVQL